MSTRESVYLSEYLGIYCNSNNRQQPWNGVNNNTDLTALRPLLTMLFNFEPIVSRAAGYGLRGPSCTAALVCTAVLWWGGGIFPLYTRYLQMGWRIDSINFSSLSQASFRERQEQIFGEFPRGLQHMPTDNGVRARKRFKSHRIDLVGLLRQSNVIVLAGVHLQALVMIINSMPK